MPDDDAPIPYPEDAFPEAPHTETAPMSENRVESMSVAVSPTGQPVVSPGIAKWMAGIVGLAALGSQLLPSHTIAAKACGVIVAIGAVLGIASPGLRR